MSGDICYLSGDIKFKNLMRSFNYGVYSRDFLSIYGVNAPNMLWE
jgi:hypothetical protein